MIALYTPRAISVVREMRDRLNAPPKSVDDFLNTLHQVAERSGGGTA